MKDGRATCSQDITTGQEYRLARSATYTLQDWRRVTSARKMETDLVILVQPTA